MSRIASASGIPIVWATKVRVRRPLRGDWLTVWPRPHAVLEQRRHEAADAKCDHREHEGIGLRVQRMQQRRQAPSPQAQAGKQVGPGREAEGRSLAPTLPHADEPRFEHGGRDAVRQPEPEIEDLEPKPHGPVGQRNLRHHALTIHRRRPSSAQTDSRSNSCRFRYSTSRLAASPDAVRCFEGRRRHPVTRYVDEDGVS